MLLYNASSNLVPCCSVTSLVTRTQTCLIMHRNMTCNCNCIMLVSHDSICPTGVPSSFNLVYHLCILCVLCFVYIVIVGCSCSFNDYYLICTVFIACFLAVSFACCCAKGRWPPCPPALDAKLMKQFASPKQPISIDVVLILIIQPRCLGQVSGGRATNPAVVRGRLSRVSAK